MWLVNRIGRSVIPGVTFPLGTLGPMTGLGRFTSPEIATGDWRLLVPLGSIEQHGPHLPVDTDLRIAVAVAERAAARLPGTLVSPPVPVGAAGEHAGFPGTLSIGTPALTAMLVELVRTAGPEWRAITLVNGHGGNIEAIREAERVCRSEGRELHSWSPTDPGGDAHAGETETSVMLAIAPEAVRVGRLEPGVLDELSTVMDRLRREGVAAVSPSGVLGDPTAARADRGLEILDRWVGELVDLLQR